MGPEKLVLYDLIPCFGFYLSWQLHRSLFVTAIANYNPNQ